MHAEYQARTFIGEPAKASPLTLEWVGPARDTAAQAWQDLADFRVDVEDEREADTGEDVDRDVSAFMSRDEPGDLWLADPGREGDDMHPGRTYSVIVTN